MKLKRFFFAALCAALTLGAAARVQPNLLSKVDQAKMNEWVEHTFSHMTPDERITQLFVMCVASCTD
ncbi:MAG: hypothetical protein HUK11_04870, partial [Muribaculaceae bacterium]|nr:hypothetical protein [Muribaculaceae bacterium]